MVSDPGPRTGYIRVASSGPYSVEMRSEKGYRLSYPGGDPAVANQSLGYRATLLGQTRDPSNEAAVRQICSRAGLAGAAPSQGTRIPLTVTLLEGGQGKRPSANYRDNLIVTLTPLVDPQAGTPCAP